jgi:hypothetical protein
LTRLQARIHSGNVRSERLLRRLRFGLESPAQPMEVRPGVTRSCTHFGLSLAN